MRIASGVMITEPLGKTYAKCLSSQLLSGYGDLPHTELHNSGFSYSEQLLFIAETFFTLLVSGNFFALAFLNGRFKVTMLPHVWENSRFGNLSLKSTEG